jgi:hypothetical protein
MKTILLQNSDNKVDILRAMENLQFCYESTLFPNHGQFYWKRILAGRKISWYFNELRPATLSTLFQKGVSMKRSKVFTLVALVTAVMIWGCSQSTTGPSGPSTADLIGKWIFSSVHVTGSTLMHFGIPTIHDTTITTDTTITMSGNTNYAQFNADMTYFTQMPAMASMGGSVSDSGTWSNSGSNLRLISYAKDTTNLNASISGNTGTFVNSTSQRLDNPTGLLPGSYAQSSITSTVHATKQ